MVSAAVQCTPSRDATQQALYPTILRRPTRPLPVCSFCLILRTPGFPAKSAGDQLLSFIPHRPAVVRHRCLLEREERLISEGSEPVSETTSGRASGWTMSTLRGSAPLSASARPQRIATCSMRSRPSRCSSGIREAILYLF